RGISRNARVSAMRSGGLGRSAGGRNRQARRLLRNNMIKKREKCLVLSSFDKWSSAESSGVTGGMPNPVGSRSPWDDSRQLPLRHSETSFIADRSDPGS